MSDVQPHLAEAVKRAKEIAAKMVPGAAPLNGEDPGSRKRPLDEVEEGPSVKKPNLDGADPQAIAQAAIAKVGAQLGLTQMITIEIKVPNRMVGLVIGRGGEMINRLQADSAARIQVAPDGSEVSGERQVSIYGTPEAVEKAKSLVSKVVEDAGGVTSLPTFTQMSVEPGQEVVELMIPSNKVGLVIGKGGEMIKALQERAGCKMQMIQDGPYANSPEKPLRMTGAPDSCRRARELVLELIEQKELEARGLTGDLTYGLPQTIEIQVPRGLVGFVIGRNGEHINNIQNTCGVRLQFQNDIPNTSFRMATISGLADSCQKAKKMVEDIVAEVGQRDDMKPAEQQFSLMGYKPRLELPNPTGPGVQTVQISVPGNKCGLVIGKGGDTIRQLQVQSGAHIELHRGNHPNPQEKLFNVRDQHQAAWAAYYQQLYAAQAAQAQQQGQQGQQPAPGGPGGSGAPSSQGSQPAQDVQAQWAEYYRQLGYAYYGQGGSPANNPEQKVLHNYQ